MKKLLVSLLVVFMTLPTIAQISAIQVEDKPYERIGRGVIYWKAKGIYEYRVWSNNQYEDKEVVLNLGKSPEEVIASLENLAAVKGNVGKVFNLQGYKFTVGTYSLDIANSGILQYTAGDYYINFSTLDSDIKKVKELLTPKVEVVE